MHICIDVYTYIDVYMVQHGAREPQDDSGGRPQAETPPAPGKFIILTIQITILQYYCS